MILITFINFTLPLMSKCPYTWIRIKGNWLLLVIQIVQQDLVQFQCYRHFPECFSHAFTWLWLSAHSWGCMHHYAIMSNKRYCQSGQAYNMYCLIIYLVKLDLSSIHVFSKNLMNLCNQSQWLSYDHLSLWCITDPSYFN